MLEVRAYPHAELAALLHTTDNQGIKRKLTRYEVEYSCTGQGRNAVYQITAIPDAFKHFKLFCITELEMAAQTDFIKFRNFLYYFMNDEDFRWLPDETLEIRLRENNIPVSRATISNYKRRLEQANLICTFVGDLVYYFASGNQQRIVTKEEYSKAWAEYWENKAALGYIAAAAIMKENYGGMARKQHKAEINVITLSAWDKLNELVCQSIENELGNSD